MAAKAASDGATANLWEAYTMSLDAVTERLRRITRALEEHSVPYALVGGQAVASFGWPPRSRPHAGATG